MPTTPVTRLKIESDPLLVREVAIAYMAGFFDGEGCIGVYPRQGYWTIQVTVSQKNTAPLELFKATFPGFSESTMVTGVTNVVWMGPIGAGVVFELLPHLRCKKDQAVAALELSTIQDNRRHRGHNAKFTAAELERMDQLARVVRELKYGAQTRGT